ncbi:unnamed protein product [Thelazia callipaeda]|uniref:ATG11 domain-containing protein n=1 Tax=Thelazia callipaeda TaxID=103827 RepID=A0A0N5D830_THECL|nr:unnamed protein product [Thelazia callipaeda]
MFYVFYVNQGSLQALDVSVALGSVHKLQCVIEEITCVPIVEQALLVSGGEGLLPEKQVSHYQGTGTESNPVFLFRKLCRENSQNADHAYSDDLSPLYTGFYDELHILDSSTISRPLITRYCDAGRLGIKIAERSLQFCARLVQDHQLLHQGWLALISNLCDSRTQIVKKSERFFSRYERLRTMKGKAESLLQDFDNVLRTLSQIKIPSALLSNSYKLQGMSRAAEECTLYEYIARADPQNSLEEMSEQVNLLLSKTNDTEYRQVISNMKYVNEKVNNYEMRTIRGINTRLTQLDSMFHNKEQQMKVLRNLCFAVSQSTFHSTDIRVSKFMFISKDIVLGQREKMLEVKKLIEQMQKMGRAFEQSKIELLSNIRTRLRGWILQVYDRLHTTNNQITLFEEKYIVLRNRLDIIRQVKESPTMYATALTECLRRSVLQPEFESWFTSFMGKSVTLIAEETSVREVFKQKLGRHFLKQLFPGMFDSFPNFTCCTLTQFDKNLPPVSTEDLRNLRQAVPCLTNLLKVTDPFIYLRLSVKDPRVISGSQMTPVLKREESFYTTDATINVTNLNKNFPSTHWLSGDENLDVSPSNATIMAKSPPSRFGSTGSLDITDESSTKPLNPFAALFDVSNNETPENRVEVESEAYSVLNASKSEPIAIPQSVASACQVVVPSVEEENSLKPLSNKSSQFGTPEDHINYQRRVADVFDRSGANDLLYLRDALKKLLKELMHFKEELVLSVNQVREYSGEVLEKISSSIVAYIECAEKSAGTDMFTKPKLLDAVTETEEENQLEESFVMSDGEKSSEKDNRILELQQIITAQEKKIERLREQQSSAKNTIANPLIYRMEAERSEMYKTLGVDHELALERRTSSYGEEMMRKNKEIESLKMTLHMLRVGSSHFTDSAVSTAAVSGNQSAYEQKYKHGNPGMCGHSLVCKELDETEKEYQLATEFMQCTEIATGLQANEVSKEYLQKPFTISNRTTNEAKDIDTDVSTDETEGHSDEDIAPVTSKPATVQTTISLREMRTMITVQDIHEFCAVLIVWSEPHDAYILFSISPVFHFVKERSLKRMGVKWDRQSVAVSTVGQRPNWLMAVTTRLELCKIRKADNRYNLKVGTKFYRVEVEPLQIDSSSIRRHTDD